ncbi:MAG TPA: EF-hand domain-containing protein [Asticcacaulis sp.]
MLRILVVTGALALGSSLAARAQEPPPRPDFAALDANHDGRLDLSEFTAPMQARAKAVFDRMDAKHDGVVTESEFNAFRPENGPPRDGPPRMGPLRMGPPPDFRSLDANGDGKINFAEFSAREKARFDRLDANHDGVLEPAELSPPKAAGGAVRP